MVTTQENEIMTRIGPGTPAGELLRRYWHPICPAAELTPKEPKKRVRLLGENLVLFRDESGNVGLIPEQCPHRKASLFFGFIEEDGIRCAYHGWKFDGARKCMEQPAEPSNSRLKDDVRPSNYKVEKMAGLYWAYMGPLPAPLLPRWEPLVSNEGVRRIIMLPVLDCNWLQVMENSLDSTHVLYLHAHMMIKMGMPEKAAFYSRPIKETNFHVVKDKVWAGIWKARTWGGDRPEVETGHPLIFPHILLSPQEEHLVMHFRVPLDDTHTQVIRVQFTPGEDTSKEDWDAPEVIYVPPFRNEKGEYNFKSFAGQDAMAWETEGEIVDRSTELLGTSDKGIVMYRRMMMEQIRAVQAGQEPIGVMRDPKENEKIVIKVSDGQAATAREVKAPWSYGQRRVSEKAN